MENAPADEAENVFQFRYIDVPMWRDFEDGHKGFNLRKLEVIGRITNKGLDIEVSSYNLSRTYVPTTLLSSPRPATVR